MRSSRRTTTVSSDVESDSCSRASNSSLTETSDNVSGEPTEYFLVKLPDGTHLVPHCWLSKDNLGDGEEKLEALLRVSDAVTEKEHASRKRKSSSREEDNVKRRPSTTPDISVTEQMRVLQNKVMEMDAKIDKLVDTLNQFMENQEKLRMKEKRINKNLNNLIITFPMKTVKEVDQLEIKLEDELYRSHLVKELQLIGGKDIRSIVVRQWQYLMTSELASQFSLYGTSDKKPLLNHKLLAVISEVTNQYSSVTEQQIKRMTQNWLRSRKIS